MKQGRTRVAKLCKWIHTEIADSKATNELSLKKGTFTREKKLNAPRIVTMIHRGVYGAIQLDHVFEAYKETSISKQAFSKARANLWNTRL